MNQFKNLLCLIDKHLNNPRTSEKDRQKLLKAKHLIESDNETDWVKGFEIMGRLLTGVTSSAHFFHSVWNWLCNLF